MSQPLYTLTPAGPQKYVSRLFNSIWETFMVFLLPFWHTYLWQSLKKNDRIIFEKIFPRNLEERKIEPFFRPNFAKGYLSSFREVPGIPMDEALRMRI